MPELSPFPFSLGLTGFPLGHSLSPKLHAAALRAVGLQGEYKLYPISPDDPQALAQLLGRVHAGELHGLNVTIPHKQTVIPLLDELTGTAQAVGAVNTIYLRDDKLIGDNTDVPGFLADLKKFVGALPPSGTTREVPLRALVLGAGGSARAVVYALAQDGWDVTIAARKVEQAEGLETSLKPATGDGSIRCLPLQAGALQSHLEAVSLVVNTTPLGMAPNTEASPWPEDLPFPRADVYDLVYNPRETLFVRQVRAAGLRAQTGLGMLVEQAALAFEIWTGRVPPREVMFEAVGATRFD
jgi:shikimate dehydrogenase